MSQKSFDFIDDNSVPHQIDLDDEQRQLLIDLMSNIVIQVFHLQEGETDE